MTEPSKTLKLLMTCLAACLFSLASVSCAPAVASLTATPAIQTVVVTRVATHVVTSEVTQLVEVPVTLTPNPTATETPTPYLSPTRTPVPSLTPTYTPPRVTILADSGCWYGPGFAYLFKYGLNATVWMWVFGRNMDGTWLDIRALNDRPGNACWIRADLVRFDQGELKDVPIVWTTIPYATNLYEPPLVSATRSGNDVTIFWQPVYMTEDDYRGYLIEAWVCQGGVRVFLPIKYVLTFDQNNFMMNITVKDEPGCDVPSSARIYSAEKHGYTAYRMVPWPAFTK